MRPVLVVDLICAGRAVLEVHPFARQRVVQTLVQHADIADNLRQSGGGVHPEFGDGTLAAAARRLGMAAEPAICDTRFATALILVLQGLIAHAAETSGESQ